MLQAANQQRTCERCGAELESGELRCSVCALAVHAMPRSAETETARIVRCQSCGASLSWVAEVAAPKCAFCGSVMEIAIQADPPEQHEFYLPFTVNAEQARAALSGFLGRKSFFRPSDLSSAATLDSLRTLWWPAWIFSARALVSWTADSNVGAGRADWAPHAGSVRATFDNMVVSASRGLSAAECSQLAPKYALDSRSASPEGLENAQAHVERFDVNRSGARRHLMEAIQKLAEAQVRPHVPGSRIRKLHTAVLLEGLDTHRYGLPAYVLAYRYNGELYRVVIHGQDANCLIGKAPVSGWKVLLTIIGVLAGLIAIALLFGR